MKAIKLGVGVCTRDRPYMFKALLKELAKQKIPNGAEVTFIFVENDADVSIAKTVNELKDTLVARGMADPRICIEPEPKLGVPFARNRMLEIALHFDLDFLAVLDDDEYPADENWLCEMFKGIYTRRLDIASGLLRIEPMDKEDLYSFGRIPRIIYQSLVSPKREKRMMAYYRNGEGDKTFHRGSNVIYRLSLIRKNKIRFNEQLELAHGEDREINFEIKRAGGKGGLVPEAIVYERVRDERLTLGYQFQVQRASGLVRYGKQYQGLQSSKSGSFRVFSYVLAKLILGFARLLLVPVTGGHSLVGVARSFGSAVGGIEGLLGRKSEHYAETDGL